MDHQVRGVGFDYVGGWGCADDVGEIAALLGRKEDEEAGVSSVDRTWNGRRGGKGMEEGKDTEASRSHGREVGSAGIARISHNSS